MNVRRHIEVSGIVQGVGFRPHVYRLARERALAGEISNTPSGATIEVQGPQESIDDFVVRLRQEAPPWQRSPAWQWQTSLAMVIGSSEFLQAVEVRRFIP